MLERGFAHGALEHQNLVGQVQRITVTEVDFHLRRAFLVDQGVQIQALQFAPVVHVFEQRVEFVRRVDGEALTAGFRTTGAAYRRHQREIRVTVAFGQVELHLWRDDGFPAFVGIHLQHFLEDVARRQLDGVALLVEGVVDHHGSGLDGPGHNENGVGVRTAEHVDVRLVQQVVIDVVLDIVASHGLQQHALWEAHALLVEELVGRRDLAASNAGQVADQAFDFGDFAFFQPARELV